MWRSEARALDGRFWHSAARGEAPRADLLQTHRGHVGALPSARLWRAVGGDFEVHLPGESAQISPSAVNCRERFKSARSAQRPLLDE